MGFDVEDFPNPLLVAIKCQSANIAAFHRNITTAFKNSCDALMTPIFPDQYILQTTDGKYDLDHCYITSDKQYQKSHTNICCPIINTCIWETSDLMRKNFFELTSGYLGYLSIGFFCIELQEKYMDKILQTFAWCKKALKSCHATLILIVETDGSGGEENDIRNESIWQSYIEFRGKLEKMDFPLKIQLALIFKPNLCSNQIFNRWKSEKISYFIIRPDCFVANPKGYRVLPAKHERVALELLLLKSFFTYEVQQLLDGNQSHEECFSYVLHIYNKMAKNKLTSDKDAIKLIDYLQDPLQPYADNLESQTYQIFENDQIKYDEYENAMQMALEKLPKEKKAIVYYIGCGRGGLLYAIFEAAKRINRKVFVYAIEKNPYPIQTVKKRIKQNRWEKSIKVIQTDVKDYVFQEKADIFISELLGGFGDNELSPECLFWAEKNISPDTICIPQDYISYIRPVSYQQMHRNIKVQHRHSYYTVLYGSYHTNFDSQEVWKFEHPFNPYTEQQFNKYGKNTFTSKQTMMINGFAGYFTTKLQDHVELSILPERPTLRSYSWFPLYFPFQQAVLLQKGKQITIEMWRKHAGGRVWYQWKYFTEQKESILHNQNGFCIAIELS